MNDEELRRAAAEELLELLADSSRDYRAADFMAVLAVLSAELLGRGAVDSADICTRLAGLVSDELRELEEHADPPPQS